jgi:predicted cupin superfamily sugar epimerase
MDPEVRALIDALGLAPHPEGGWYAETFRDTAGAAGAPDVADTSGRGASSAIYYLLEAGGRSVWHRVDAAEIWHHYAGAVLDLAIGDTLVRLGPDVAAGQRPQAVVPAGVWQAADARAGWVLVGCTVAPGFDFAGFELAPGDPLDPPSVTD